MASYRYRATWWTRLKLLLCGLPVDGAPALHPGSGHRLGAAARLAVRLHEEAPLLGGDRLVLSIRDPSPIAFSRTRPCRSFAPHGSLLRISERIASVQRGGRRGASQVGRPAARPLMLWRERVPDGVSTQPVFGAPSRARSWFTATRIESFGRFGLPNGVAVLWIGARSHRAIGTGGSVLTAARAFR